jgi:DNA-binding MarR family transcriptional regulator
MSDRTADHDPGLIFALSELVAAVRRLDRELDATARTLHQDAGLSVAERQLLLILRREGPLTMPVLAERKGATRQYVRQTLVPLAKRGLVERLPNPEHRRSPLIALSDAGRTVMREALRREGGWLRDAAAGLDREAVADATDVLRKVADAALNGPSDGNVV